MQRERASCRRCTGSADPGRRALGPLALIMLVALLASGCDLSANVTPLPGRTPKPSATGPASGSATPGQSGSPGPSGSGAPGTPSGSGPVGSGPPTGSPDPFVQAALDALATDADLAGQLIIAGWVGHTADTVVPTLDQLHPGGIVFVAENTSRADRARAITSGIVSNAFDLGMVPPFIAIDHEGGRIQRIVNVANLGSNQAFAATNPTAEQACERGTIHAQQLLSLGFNMNLAPVLDVLTNPANTVIGDRSYGSDPALVARLGAGYIQGLQGRGVIAVAKHFPGHGGTDVDSHVSLPVITLTLKNLAKVELVPFARAIEPDVNVGAIMVGHLALSKVDPSGTPASLSEPIIQGVLRDRMGYDGLVITDDLGQMGAITAGYTPRDAATQAINAGADMLIVRGELADITQYRDAIVDGLANGTIPRDRVMNAVRHVLEAKRRFGLLGGEPPAAFSCR